MRKTIIALCLFALTACGGAMREAEAGETTQVTVNISFGTATYGYAAFTVPSDSASVAATIVILQSAWDDPLNPTGFQAALMAHEISHLLFLSHSTSDSCISHGQITSPFPSGPCSAEVSAASEKASKYRYVIGTCPTSVSGPMTTAIAQWESCFPGLFP